MTRKDSKGDEETVNEFTKTVSQKEFSEILGVTTARIRQLDKEDAFEKVGRCKYHLAKSIQKYIDFQITKAVGNLEEDMNKLKEDTLWTRARRKKSELEYQIMSGELHRSIDVEEVMNNMLTSFRSQLLAFPSKNAPKLVMQKEVTLIQELLKTSIYELMEELADYDPDIFYEKSRDKIFIEAEAEVIADAKHK